MDIMNEMQQIAPGSSVLLEKWGHELNAINEAFDGKLDYVRQITTAMMLENANNQLARVEAMNEGTQLADIGFFKKYGINLLAAAIPNLIAPDIVSMQPMQNRIGEMRYLKVLYGSDKGSFKAGDTMFSSFQGGHGQTGYTSDTIEDEVLGADIESTTAKANLSWLPVVPGKVKIVINDTIVVTDNGNKVLSGPGITGTIDYNSGAVTLTGSEINGEATIVATYEYDNINSPVQAPEITFKIATTPIVAKSRKLKATYSLDASFDLTKDYGMQINNEIVTYTSAQIKHEIDGEIMNDLLRVATAKGTTWDKTPRDGISLRDHNESFNNVLVEASNNIFEATKLASGSFLVVGMETSNIVETLPRFRPSGVVKPVGPHLVGYLGSMPVYKNPFYPANAYLVGWKGTGLFDAGYLYCPYMPIMSTQLIMDSTFEGQRGFATAYGKKTVNGNFYSKGTITAS